MIQFFSLFIVRQYVIYYFIFDISFINQLTFLIFLLFYYYYFEEGYKKM